MSPTTEGRTHPYARPTDNTCIRDETVQHPYDIPTFPSGGDPARRLAMHHRFVRRRRWSRELDVICGRWAA